MRTNVFRATCPRRVLWGDPVYLAGDTSTFTTGSDIIVDGAFTCF